MPAAARRCAEHFEGADASSHRPALAPVESAPRVRSCALPQDCGPAAPSTPPPAPPSLPPPMLPAPYALRKVSDDRTCLDYVNFTQYGGQNGFNESTCLAAAVSARQPCFSMLFDEPLVIYCHESLLQEHLLFLFFWPTYSPRVWYE